MIVCIAEKPSVAHDIAGVLGATTRHDGYYEGAGYQVTWTFGHLCELKYPEDYYEPWKRWSLAALPIMPPRFGIRLKKDKGVERQFNVIKSLFLKADKIINCGDAGQEGELIQRWVLQMTGAKCPVERLWISSLTPESIRQGFSSLKSSDAYANLYAAGLCRAIGDWLLGINATRLYTLKYGAQERGAQPLSVGRVQTPTLSMIVSRQDEIDHFVPQPYWVLTTVYRDTTFTAGEGKYATEEKAQRALLEVKGKDLMIGKITRKEGREAPPRLFDLTTLQVECNKRLSLTADRTLQIAQSLYEKHVTTYPRVDTTYLSDDIYPKCGPILNRLTSYAALLQPLRGSKLRKSKKVFDSSKVTDHHAIIPTGEHTAALLPDEAQVYDMIVRRFIAVFYPDCRFAQTTVLAKAGSISFKATGRQILEEGWQVCFPGSTRGKDAKGAQDDTADKDDGKDGDGITREKVLPSFTEGESGPHRPALSRKMTQPPKPYTEATLLRAMESAGKAVDDETLREAMKENGIGRPSTRAAIIETLFRRHYIVRQRKSICPTETGRELIATIHIDLLKSPELTGRWEKKLREIEHGDYSAPQFITELKEMTTDIVRRVMSEQETKRVMWTGKPAKATGRSTSRAAAATKVAKTTATRRRKTAAAPAVVHEGDRCPLCGEGTVIRGHTAYGCSRWREGCTFRAPLEGNNKPAEGAANAQAANAKPAEGAANAQAANAKPANSVAGPQNGSAASSTK